MQEAFPAGCSSGLLVSQLQEPREGAQKRRRKPVRKFPELVTRKLVQCGACHPALFPPSSGVRVPGVTSVWGNTPARACWTLVDIDVTSQGQG